MYTQYQILQIIISVQVNHIKASIAAFISIYMAAMCLTILIFCKYIPNPCLCYFVDVLILKNLICQFFCKFICLST